MISVTLFFLLGVCTLHLFSALPSLQWVMAGFSVLVFLFIVLIKKYKPYWILAYGLGFFWVWIHASLVLDKRLPEAMEGVPATVIGKIISIPEKRDNKIRFDFQVKETGNIRLHWKLVDEKEVLRVGDEWQFLVKLKRPRSYANPGSFDTEKHLFQNRINAEGYVLDKPEIANNQKRASSFLSHPIDRLRTHIKMVLQTLLKNREFSGLIQALVIGVRDEIALKQWEVFQNTGTAHLMAISGLHVGLVASGAYFISGLLYRCVLSERFHFPTPWVSALFAMVGAIFYGLLAGFSIPTKRSVVMVSAFMFGILLRKRFPVGRIFCLTVLIVLILDPLSTLSPGFWLSFSAVLFILYGMRGRVYVKSGWWRWGRMQWVVFVGLIPISLVFFQKISIISPLANSIAIPWVSFLVVPFALIGTGLSFINTFLGGVFLRGSEFLFSILWVFLKYLSTLKMTTWENFTFTPLSIALAILGGMIILAPKGIPIRYIGFIWLLPLVWIKPNAIPLKSFRMSVLDVGQGLSTVIETANHVLVYDTGPKLSSTFNTGERVVLPFLAYYGHQKIDVLMISHGDNDHYGGADSILKKSKVKSIITSEPALFSEQSQKNVSLCYAGQKWVWDGVVFEVLHPETVVTRKRNDHSCVLKVSVGEQAVLLTGDIETKSEKKILEHSLHRLPAQVMLVPHHGSRTSSSLEFIQAIHPKFAIIPVGYRNQYGHPKADIVERYKNLGINLLNTSVGGAIMLIMDEKGFVQLPVQYRADHHYYWQE